MTSPVNFHINVNADDGNDSLLSSENEDNGSHFVKPISKDFEAAVCTYGNNLERLLTYHELWHQLKEPKLIYDKVPAGIKRDKFFVIRNDHNISSVKAHWIKG